MADDETRNSIKNLRAGFNVFDLPPIQKINSKHYTKLTEQQTLAEYQSRKEKREAKRHYSVASIVRGRRVDDMTERHTLSEQKVPSKIDKNFSNNDVSMKGSNKGTILRRDALDCIKKRQIEEMKKQKAVDREARKLARQDWSESENEVDRTLTQMIRNERSISLLDDVSRSKSRSKGKSDSQFTKEEVYFVQKGKDGKKTMTQQTLPKSKQKRRVSTDSDSEDKASDSLLRNLIDMPSLTSSSSEDEKSKLERKCPFCHDALLPHLSPKLEKLFKYLISLPHCTPKPTLLNPDGLSLPLRESVPFCVGHRNECVVIPEGKKKWIYWDIDWQDLPKRVKSNKYYPDFNRIIGHPETSEFFLKAKMEWEVKGKRKMMNVMSEYDTFEVQVPGYYGDRGSEIIFNAIHEEYVETCALLDGAKTIPLSIQTFIRRVLVPEIGMRLIQEDTGCSSLEEAKEVMEMSREFGRAMWPDFDEDEQKINEKELELEMKREKSKAKAKKNKIEVTEDAHQSSKNENATVKCDVDRSKTIIKESSQQNNKESISFAGRGESSTSQSWRDFSPVDTGTLQPKRRKPNLEKRVNVTLTSAKPTNSELEEMGMMARCEEETSPRDLQTLTISLTSQGSLPRERRKPKRAKLQVINSTVAAISNPRPATTSSGVNQNNPTPLDLNHDSDTEVEDNIVVKRDSHFKKNDSSSSDSYAGNMTILSHSSSTVASKDSYRFDGDVV